MVRTYAVGPLHFLLIFKQKAWAMDTGFHRLIVSGWRILPRI